MNKYIESYPQKQQLEYLIINAMLDFISLQLESHQSIDFHALNLDGTKLTKALSPMAH